MLLPWGVEVLDKHVVAAEEEALRAQVSELADEKRQKFYAALKVKLKDPDTFAVLNYLFVTGLHHFYLGHYVRGMVNFMGFVFAVALMVIGLWQWGLMVLVAFSITEVYALFRSQVIVQDYNNQLMRKLLETL
ncbi:MAG: hypothetical protein R8K49_03995 [Mariprofundaceae bacterium]